MKRFPLLLLLICLSPFAFAQYESKDISLLANWIDPSFAHNDTVFNYNSVWGFKDQVKNREYAIFGGKNGTYFIEVTNPAGPVFRDYVPGRRNNCIWREYKTFKNYAYLISDDAAPNSFQIADLSHLPDSVHLVHDSDSIFVTAHTLFIDQAKEKLYCASVREKTNIFHSMAVYDLADPKKPLFLRSLNQDYPGINLVHDMFVRNDTIYASAGYQGLYVFVLTPDNRFLMIGSITSYPGMGYNHSSWLSEDGKTLVFADEIPENLPVKIADISDFTNLRIASTFKAKEGSTPHNPYVVGNNYLVMAYYQDGVQIYDITNPYNPIKKGFFDTYPQNGNNYFPNRAYNGCWGAYPYLPSGILLASDRQNGLFILDPSLILSAKNSLPENTFKIYPNPFKELIHIELPAFNGLLRAECYDISGRRVYSKNITLQAQTSIEIDLESLFPGVYFLKLTSEGFQRTEKIVKH
jgi:choice-of-anchor B domain-containing protein